MQLSHEAKEKVGHMLADLMIGGLERGELTIEESEDSAEYILDYMQRVTTQAELVTFLKRLSEMWYVYNPAFIEAEKYTLMNKVEEELKQIANQQHQ